MTREEEVIQALSLLSRDPILNFLVLALRHDVPRDQITGFIVRTGRDHPIGFGGAQTGQNHQLIS